MCEEIRSAGSLNCVLEAERVRTFNLTVQENVKRFGTQRTNPLFGLYTNFNAVDRIGCYFTEFLSRRG